AGGRGERTSRTPAQAKGRALASLWRAAAEVRRDSHPAAGARPRLTRGERADGRVPAKAAAPEQDPRRGRLPEPRQADRQGAFRGARVWREHDPGGGG